MADVIEVRLLRPDDKRSEFESGHHDLDRFFRQYAAQNQFRHHLGATYVAHDGAKILGYATIAAAHIEIDDLPISKRKKLPNYPLPVLRLARLAVDRAAQGRGVGKFLLRSIFEILHNMAESFGCVGVVVDAKAESVVFYRRYGFVPLALSEGKLGSRPEPLPMFVSLGSIPRGRGPRKGAL